ncbi:hypothetical protein NL676_033765 [Syzygium grande]|nr:hypothetical protein NL676_033765 [Syzygium grande]
MQRLGETLRTNKVLVVLDDVDNKELIKNLTGNYSLHSGSRIIITTRNTTILQVDGFKGEILRLWIAKEALEVVRTDEKKDKVEALEIGGLDESIEITNEELKRRIKPNHRMQLLVDWEAGRVTSLLLDVEHLVDLEFWSGEVEDIPLDGLPLLENLTVHDCKLLRRLSIPLELRKLRQACVACCPELVVIQVGGLLKSLESFSILRCVSLRRVGGLNELESLKYLEVRECTSLERLIDASCANIADDCYVHIRECGDFIIDSTTYYHSTTYYQRGISLKHYRELIVLDTSIKPPVTTVDLKFSGSGLHSKRRIRKIRKIITETEGVLDVAINRNLDTATVKGVMDAEALAENLRDKMKWEVEIVLLNKEKEGGKATDKEVGWENRKGGDYHKAAEITGGWGKVESQRMEFQGACGYGHCAYRERTGSYATMPYGYYPRGIAIFSDENASACSVMRRTHPVQSVSVVFLQRLYCVSGFNPQFLLIYDIFRVIPGTGLVLRGGLAGCDGPKAEEVDDLELQVRTAVRMRKHKHLDDLMAQVAQLNKDKRQIRTKINITTQHYLGIRAANAVLRTQVGVTAIS